ncbi:MAG TPA: hypothetical protein V6C86_21060 [Oculatellaceae cyanobacterium]
MRSSVLLLALLAAVPVSAQNAPQYQPDPYLLQQQIQQAYRSAHPYKSFVGRFCRGWSQSSQMQMMTGTGMYYGTRMQSAAPITGNYYVNHCGNTDYVYGPSGTSTVSHYGNMATIRNPDGSTASAINIGNGTTTIRNSDGSFGTLSRVGPFATYRGSDGTYYRMTQLGNTIRVNP